MVMEMVADMADKIRLSFCAAFSLLVVSCAGNGEIDDTSSIPQPGVRTLTIDCSTGAKETPSSRTQVDYGDESPTEKFLWSTGDTFSTYLQAPDRGAYSTTPALFAIDEAYGEQSPSSFAKFHCQNFPAEHEKYNAIAITGGATCTSTDESLTLTYTVPSTATQSGKTTDHLRANMIMYAKQSLASTGNYITLHHLTSMMRFTVKNLNARSCKITSISMSCSKGKVFTSTDALIQPIDWNTDPAFLTPAGDLNTLTLHFATENNVTLAKNDVLEGYLLTLPAQGADVDLAEETFTFDVTATDADGSNPRTYTSLKLLGEKIVAQNAGVTHFEIGKRYRFDLFLDDALLLGDVSVTPWGESTDLGDSEISDPDSAN